MNMMSATHIIRQLEERHVATKVDLMVWSNKMDLIALSNTKGEITLHRLTWQKVWVLPPPTPDYCVRHISWRPDGRVIAVAYVPKELQVGTAVRGEVMLVDVENKDILHSTTVTDDVSCLMWLQERHTTDHHHASHTQDGTSDFLPKLPSLSRTFGSLPDNLEENLEDAKRIKDQSELNFLLIGTCDGNLHLSVFGLFSCGVINISKYMAQTDAEKYPSLLSAELSHDMKSLFLLVAVDDKKHYPETTKDDSGLKRKEKTELLNNEPLSPPDENVGTQNQETINVDSSTPDTQSSEVEENNGKRELKIVILDTRVIASRSVELYALSLKHGHVMSLLDYLSQTMRSIIEAWENIYILEIESKLSKHAESLPEGSVSADFLELLLLGVPSDSLENFLLRELNDKGIKKLGHSIELSHSNIQKLILKHLLSVGHSLAYHLAEMKGMAKLTDRFKVLGLEEDAVAEAFNAAGAFLIKSTEVQLVIDKSMKRYKAFFRWLYAIILRITDDRIPDLTMTDMSQQDLEFIAEYLHNIDVKTDEDGVKRHCYLDRLGQYLVDQNLRIPPAESTDSNHWRKLLEQNPCLQNHCNIIERCKNTSLLQQHNHLKEAINNVFKTPEYAIGNMFQLKKVVHITDSPYKRVSMCLLDDSMLLLSLVETNFPDEFKMIQVPTDIERNEIVSKTMTFIMNKKNNMRPLDLQFYQPEILSVLLESTIGHKNAKIMLVYTKAIYESSLESINMHSVMAESVTLHHIDDMVASTFAVSGARKVAIVLSESQRKVRLFELEAEAEDEEEDEEPLMHVAKYKTKGTPSMEQEDADLNKSVNTSQMSESSSYS